MKINKEETKYLKSVVGNVADNIHDGGVDWGMSPVDMVTNMLESMEGWIFDEEAEWFDSVEEAQAAKAFYIKFNGASPEELGDLKALIILYGEEY